MVTDEGTECRLKYVDPQGKVFQLRDPVYLPIIPRIGELVYVPYRLRWRAGLHERDGLIVKMVSYLAGTKLAHEPIVVLKKAPEGWDPLEWPA